MTCFLGLCGDLINFGAIDLEVISAERTLVRIRPMKTSRLLCFLLGATATSLATAASPGAAVNYRLLTEIPVGGDGGWDYLTVDSPGRRLYVSHTNVVVVIDLDRNAVVGEITDTPGVHGIALAPELNRGFTTNGRENKSSVVDLLTRKTFAKLDTGLNPDGMVYLADRQEVYVFNGRGQSATVIDAKAEKVVATIPLGGKPEFAAVDAPAGRVYNNLEDRNEIAVLDAKTRSVVARWPIAPGEGASGMAFDAGHHRLFLGCSNNLMVMVDSTNGEVVATVPIGPGVDANAYDPGTQLAFASCGGDGTVVIVRVDPPAKLTVVQTLKTEPRARTMALDPRNHRIYLGAAKYETPVASPPSGQRPRPQIVPGSFKILVYGNEPS